VSSSREAILGRIRDAIADRPGLEPVLRAYRAAGGLERPARVELLCTRIRDYRAEVQRVSAIGLPFAIEAAFEQHAAKRVGIPAGIPPDWRPAGVDFI
jgi:L-lactate dehydrogenase complex protein LldG